MVLLLDPRLRRAVEQLEGELGLALEHGHEAPLDLGPEVLLLAVLLGGVRQRQVLDDAEALEALDGLGGDHRRAVVAEQRARQAALLERLREAVDERLGVLVVQVPLHVAAEPRAVVEDAEQIRGLPLPRRGEHVPLALVEVEVPEAVDVRDLVRARLARHDLALALLPLLRLRWRSRTRPWSFMNRHTVA